MAPPPRRLAALFEPGRQSARWTGQKAFVRSYMDEVYLWYNEIPAVDPADYDNIPAYFNALLVRTPDATGVPKDRFSAVRPCANALQARRRQQPGCAGDPADC